MSGIIYCKESADQVNTPRHFALCARHFHQMPPAFTSWQIWQTRILPTKLYCNLFRQDRRFMTPKPWVGQSLVGCFFFFNPSPEYGILGIAFNNINCPAGLTNDVLFGRVSSANRWALYPSKINAVTARWNSQEVNSDWRLEQFLSCNLLRLGGWWDPTIRRSPFPSQPDVPSWPSNFIYSLFIYASNKWR